MNAPIAPPKAAFDVDALRAEFPIFTREVHGKPLAYLDSAASAQKPAAVIDAMAGAMRASYANVHRGLHTLANETTAAYEEARATAARFLGAGSSREIVFTSGSTEGINLVAHGLGPTIAPGDEIVVSQMEHHSNIVPWHFLRERKGAVLRWVPVTDEGRLDMAALADMLGPKTRMVALTHQSNVLGTVTDAAEIVRLAHGVGAPVLLDGSQAAVHAPDLNLAELGVDYYVCTGHKLFGPTGIGVLYGRAERLAELRPFQGGGEMIASVREDAVTYADPPQRFEAGTPPILEAIGLGAALTWFEAVDRRAAAAHEDALAAHLADGLRQWNDVTIMGRPDGGPIVSFTADGAHAHDVAQILDRYGVAVRAGAHCAEPLMARYGVASSVRASLAPYNTMADVEAFVEAYAKARTMLG